MGASSSKQSALRVVILGGGYTGTTLAKSLDSSFDVTVIEKRDRFHHFVATPRALVEAIDDSVFIPFTRLLKRGRVIQGEATGVDAAGHVVSVTKPTGETISVPYDFLVVATGTAFTAPFQAYSTNSTTSKAKLRQLRDAITAAGSVAIVGGGPVGCETAGEIATDHRGKAVHLIHPHAELLSNPRNGDLSAKARAKARALLEGVGVTLHLNARAERLNPASLPAGVTCFAPGVFLGKYPLRLSDGTTITPDVTIFTTGGVPNTAGLRSGSLARALTTKGEVRVQPTLQVEGFADVFAIGDITANAEPKTIGVGVRKHIPIVKHNILALARAKANGVPLTTAALKAHAASTAPMLSVPIGRTTGVTQAGNTLLGGWMTRTIKGGNFFVSKLNAEFGYKTPGVYPDTPENKTAGIVLTPVESIASAV